MCDCLFEIDPFARECILAGLDDIGLTLKREDAIAVFEASHAGRVKTTALPALDASRTSHVRGSDRTATLAQDASRTATSEGLTPKPRSPKTRLERPRRRV